MIYGRGPNHATQGFFFIISSPYGRLGPLRRISLRQLSVIISSSGRWPLLDGLLKSLYQQNLKRENWDLYIIHPESHQPDDKILQKASYLNAQWIPSHKLNAALQRNLGLQKSQSPIVYFLDEDCELPHEQHLQELLNTFEQYPKVHVLGGSYRNHVNCSEFGRAYNTVCRLWQRRRIENAGTEIGTTPLLGGNLAYRRQNIDLQFDEKLGFGAEDLAFAKMAEQAGLSTLLSDELYVYHNAQHDKQGFFARAKLHGKARSKMQTDHSPSSLWTDVRVFTTTPAPWPDKYRAGLFFLTMRLQELKSNFM